jgi:hypothetical protein
MALGSTQPLVELSTRNLPGGKLWSARKADKLTAMCEPIFRKICEPRPLTTLWTSTDCYNDIFTFIVDSPVQTVMNRHSSNPFTQGQIPWEAAMWIPEKYMDL